PILVGAVLDPPGDGVENAGLVWDADRKVTAKYVKRHPVPFAEYVPLRRVARLVTAEVDRVANDFTKGDRAGVLTVGPATVGDVICFAGADHDVVPRTLDRGAQLVPPATTKPRV